MSSKEIGLDDGVSTFGYIKGGRVGIEQANSFTIDVFFDVQKLFEAVIDKTDIILASIRHILNCPTIHDISIFALISVQPFR